MEFAVEHKDAFCSARAGVIKTSRGNIKTPVYMPVATRAAIRALTFRELEEIDFDAILSNTYHLYIRPGLDVLEEAKGLHRFMNYAKPILTDSGGFQVFSLADLCKIFKEGVEFRSHLDGSKHFFTPEKVLDIQKVIGSDMMMVLDQCIEYPAEKESVTSAVERTAEWAEQSFDYWQNSFDIDKQALFAIVQGGVFHDLRSACAERLVKHDFSGYAIGGLSVGEPNSLYQEMTESVLEHLPLDKPRYMMGVGSPFEILYAVMHGVDMFDSVMPTRIARNGTLFTSYGRVNIKSSRYEKDFTPLDDRCGCYVCNNFTKSYLRHIYRMGEIASLVYCTFHNLYFMKNLLSEIRENILNNSFKDIYKKWKSVY